MLARSVEGAKGSKAKEHPLIKALVQANAASLAREIAEVEDAARAADVKLQKAKDDAELARLQQAPQTPLEAERAKLFDFLTRCTTVHRDKERQVRMEEVKAKLEKRARERELNEMLRSTVRLTDRPRREGKSRLIEQGGYTILKENNYSMDEGIATMSRAVPIRKKSSRSAFSFYAKDMNAVVRDENPNWDFTTIQREVSRRWKLESDESKKPYFDLAAQDKAVSVVFFFVLLVFFKQGR